MYLCVKSDILIKYKIILRIEVQTKQISENYCNKTSDQHFK